MLHYALSLLGTPYRWGGDDPIHGFDCSGLIIELLSSVGILPHGADMTSQMLCNRFKLGAPLGQRPEFGALVFYGRSENEISHVGMLINSVCMVEAGGGTSATKDRESAANQNAFVRVRPFLARRDLVCLYMPAYAWHGAV
jgi:cell wall-associated NlpC family hydrolase